MRRRAIGIILCCTLALSGCGANAHKIVGVWKVVGPDGKDAPKGQDEITLEFTVNGEQKAGGKTAGYRVEGDQIVSIFKGPDGNETTETATIKMFSGDYLTLTRDGKDTMYKKK
jgi:hypothetical protein